MKVQQTIRCTSWLVALGLLALTLTACSGGSGSSGFDAAFTESAAIKRALAEGRCVTPETKKPIICPADVTLPPGGLGSVELGLDQANKVPCSAAGGTRCSLVLPFMPEGLPLTATYRVAVRAVDPIGSWRISAAPLENGVPSMPDFDGTVSVDVPSQPMPGSPDAPVRAQLAVLVYLTAPTSVPAEVETLAASGADFAYVTKELSLQITP
jgi:hypothetical protein